MSKVKKIYILLVLVLLLFTGSCDKKANVEFDNDSLDSISIIEAQGQENFNNFHMANHDDSQILRADVYTTASLGYRIEDGEPFSLHVISVTADVTDAVSQDSKNIEISINVTGENDVNGRFTSSISQAYSHTTGCDYRAFKASGGRNSSPMQCGEGKGRTKTTKVKLPTK